MKLQALSLYLYLKRDFYRGFLWILWSVLYKNSGGCLWNQRCFKFSVLFIIISKLIILIKQSMWLYRKSKFLFRWRFKRKHSPAKCVSCVTEIRRIKIFKYFKYLYLNRLNIPYLERFWLSSSKMLFF